MILLQLFWEFFKVGLFTVGGGMASIPFLYDMSDRMGWFSSADLVDMIAISQSTPGPIGINMATYVGYELAGVLGAVVATLSMALPSVIIVLIISKFFQKFDQHPLVQDAFYGLRPAVVALVAVAALTIVKISLINIPLYTASGNLLNFFDFKAIALFAVLFVGIRKFDKWHPVVFIAVGAAVGMLLNFQ